MTRRLAAALVVGGLLLISTLLAVAESPPVDPRGWSTGPQVQKAAGLADALSGGGPFEDPDLRAPLIGTDSTAIDLDEAITRPTLLFYFSPTCPHCRAVGPELAELHRKFGEDLDFLAIASGGSMTAEIEEFMKTFGLDFPAYKDFARKLARGIKASSTPTLLIVEPKPDSGPGARSFTTTSEFRPFVAGAGLLLEIQLRTRAGGDPWAAFEPGRYYGAKACGACHLQEFASWGLTHHSVAYWTLYERERAEDPACVGCHVTGLGEPGGFPIGDHGSTLTDVTCEACHGPGGVHSGTRRTAEELQAGCVRCHDADHSIDFSPERGIPHIDHFRAAVLGPEDFRLAREALLDGSAPRPLLAFPEGANQGSKACLSCHSDIARQWKRDPHAMARKTLRKKGSASDPECLACHALPASDAPKAVADFHSEGVGCENCHGPGEAHIAAGGGTENIVGLGQSCPECVIEAICTSCHTPEQDPDWDLSKALPKVGHKSP